MRTAACLLLLLAACGHARPAPSISAPRGAPDAGPPRPDPLQVAPAVSDETRAMLRAEGELLWTRWTTGAGPLPASAVA
ncbi:MAG TPA: hypothetical protein VLW85_18825, partial [Myxococcales bacterium]|nr:hypothetical protein [Myxococcales bacterium]